MGDRRRLTIVVAIAVAALTGAGCKSKETTNATPGPSRSAQRADRLAKGEVPEGREKAFTFPLPLHATIRVRYADSVHLVSQHSQEELANFTRARVKDGLTRAGASGTRFEGVVVAKDPSRRLTIEIRPGNGDFKSQMTVTDVTLPPEEPNITNDERWRKAGLTPDGKLIDPKQLQ